MGICCNSWCCSAQLNGRRSCVTSENNTDNFFNCLLPFPRIFGNSVEGSNLQVGASSPTLEACYVWEVRGCVAQPSLAALKYSVRVPPLAGRVTAPLWQ